MKAVRLYGVGDLRLEDASAPTPGPGEVAIDVEAVGVCASDAHYYLHGSIGGLTLGDGLILGHEFAGCVAEAGPPLAGVNGSPGSPSFTPGQRVTAEPVRPCARCRECLRGDYHLCRTLLFFGTPPTDGALRERVVLPAEWVFPLPDGVSIPEGAMMEPLAVGVYTAELAELRGGETAAVVGCGAIGLSTLQALRTLGVAQVFAEDPIEFRRGLAVTLGAEAEPPSPGVADVVAECAGTPDALRRAMELARPGGVVLVVGIPDEDHIGFPASAARRKGLTLKFVRRYRHAFPRAIRWVAEGKVQVKPFLTHRFPLEETRAAFDLAASRADGVVRAWIALNEECGRAAAGGKAS